VGVRKTIGSMRSQLVGQFLTESVLVAGMALVLALAVTQLSMPFFNLLANKSLSVPWGSPLFWAAVAGFTLFAGILSGSYPAFYLSSFRPVKVLKGTFKAGRLASLPRKMLVVVQFTITIALITGTLVVFQQINFAKEIPVGYSRRGLITVPISTPEIGQHLQAIQADLMQTGMVGGMAASSHSPAQFFTNTAIEWAGSDPQNTIFFRNVNVTHEFGKTIGWTILQGRDFSADRVGDSTAVILNAKAAEVMRLKDPIGETITWNGKTFTIIGVVDNMVTRSPYAPIEPGVFFMQGWLSVVNIRVKPDASMHEAIGKIGAVFRKHNPNAPFEYTFVDDQYAQYFADEERVGQLAGLFSALAVFISCLGLSGLASFVAEQRTKELGIRKTMGASVASLWGLLSKDFVVLVAIAFVIAVPLAFVFMNNWLAEYHHHTTLSIFLFISVGLGALFVALLTVSYQAIRAAIANPVKSLRSE
jgi:putative ABC transport system permease protein